MIRTIPFSKLTHSHTIIICTSSYPTLSCTHTHSHTNRQPTLAIILAGYKSASQDLKRKRRTRADAQTRIRGGEAASSSSLGLSERVRAENNKYNLWRMTTFATPARLTGVVLRALLTTDFVCVCLPLLNSNKTRRHAHITAQISAAIVCAGVQVRT